MNGTSEISNYAREERDVQKVLSGQDGQHKSMYVHYVGTRAARRTPTFKLLIRTPEHKTTT
eukprot:5712484-Amphidinium_carterae.1